MKARPSYLNTRSSTELPCIVRSTTAMLLPPLLTLLLLFASASEVRSFQDAEFDVSKSAEGHGTKPVQCKTVGTLLKRYVKATYKLIHYLSKYSEYMELDGLTGVQFANGEALQAFQQPYAQDPSARRLLFKLRILLRNLARMLLPIVKKRDPKYFHRFHHVVEEPVLLHENVTNLDDCHKAPYSKEELSGHDEYNENKGDNCFAELFGTASPPSHKCTVSRKCWQRLVRKGLLGKGYTTTHGILYILFFRMINCSHPSKAKVDQALHALLCRLRTQALRNLRSLRPSEADLVVEQEISLYMGGYQKFHLGDSRAFFNMLLTTQTKEGCFSEIAPLHREGPRRRLLRSMLMPGNCQSHENGLALAFFVIEIRKLLHFRHKHCL